MSVRFTREMIDAASAPYRAVGRCTWHFARGKLSHDPVFVGLLEHGLIPDRARILDIGCGQGLLASWLLAAGRMQATGTWPEDWPKAPDPVSIHGIELMPHAVERARQVLGGAATFEVGDMCSAAFGAVDAVVILDVLHYVSIAEQDGVLRRARAALAPHGTLILRVGDADGGLRFWFGAWVDHAMGLMHGQRQRRLHCRSLSDWHSALAALGFEVASIPMSRGTPFANVLLLARLGRNIGNQANEFARIGAPE